MSDLTSEDWAAIHKKVWSDDGYRSLFESDPTAAVKKYASEAGKSVGKIVDVQKFFTAEQSEGTDGPGACC